ncbi:hypothetical protein [Methylobacterium sp. WL103]|uniref:hypothetical protein n=1 Tax=Methylobacterium sp. WL103 TaxID=2603891 RepID=UPI0016508A67|nr:hypothetical protein [Methylobacterium sp. WL103]
MIAQPDARSESKTDTLSIQDNTLTIQRRERVVLTNEGRAELLNIINAMKLRGNTTLVGVANEMK